MILRASPFPDGGVESGCMEDAEAKQTAAKRMVNLLN
jgi:hypothetical protein